ncbi:hypothetical protein C2845_PM01G47210 [Panicum miliaceum]|uniref:Uncharacterized protein n=1 Tax=Panicum miliaceum TaxID=4540 RepID=A0A3L6TJ11_PANMI|nr:hypothetical protein C2845_PM01G47210 [Panicum miliaceum]
MKKEKKTHRNGVSCTKRCRHILQDAEIGETGVGGRFIVSFPSFPQLADPLCPLPFHCRSAMPARRAGRVPAPALTDAVLLWRWPRSSPHRSWPSSGVARVAGRGPAPAPAVQLAPSAAWPSSGIASAAGRDPAPTSPAQLTSSAWPSSGVACAAGCGPDPRS